MIFEGDRLSIVKSVMIWINIIARSGTSLNMVILIFIALLEMLAGLYSSSKSAALRESPEDQKLSSY